MWLDAFLPVAKFRSEYGTDASARFDRLRDRARHRRHPAIGRPEECLAFTGSPAGREAILFRQIPLTCATRSAMKPSACKDCRIKQKQ